MPDVGVVEAAIRWLAARGQIRELPGHLYVDGSTCLAAQDLAQLTATLTATAITLGMTPWLRWTTDRGWARRERTRSDAMNGEPGDF